MSAQDRYTKIIESLVNGEEAKASELMHEAFVEKAREIWSDLVEQDDIVEQGSSEDCVTPMPAAYAVDNTNLKYN